MMFCCDCICRLLIPLQYPTLVEVMDIIHSPQPSRCVVNKEHCDLHQLCEHSLHPVPQGPIWSPLWTFCSCLSLWTLWSTHRTLALNQGIDSPSAECNQMDRLDNLSLEPVGRACGPLSLLGGKLEHLNIHFLLVLSTVGTSKALETECFFVGC